MKVIKAGKTIPYCIECENHVDIAVEISEPTGCQFEDQFPTICIDCIRKALELLEDNQ